MNNSWKGYPPFWGGGVGTGRVLVSGLVMRVSEASLPLSWEGGAVGGVSHLWVRSDRTPGRGSLPVAAAYLAVFACISFRLVKILISYGTDVNLRNSSGKDR